MPVKPAISHLPWTGATAQVIPCLAEYFIDHMHKQESRFLPRTIALFADMEINSETIEIFLQEMAHRLKFEIKQRNQRVQKFSELGLLTQEDLESFLTDHSDSQPWALYYGHNGGLGSENTGRKHWREPRGVIPCSTMPNHGVAWWHSNGDLNVWLTTARKENSEWDWESDIGHESAHAAFAPVPLYIQTADLTSTLLHVESLKHTREIKPGHLARMIYAYSEMAVITIRGETRSTDTGTPILRKEELFALLKLSHELMPNEGFDRALDIYESTNGWIDVEYGTEIYGITAPMIRVIPHFKQCLKSFTPPSVPEFRNMVENQGMLI